MKKSYLQTLFVLISLNGFAQNKIYVDNSANGQNNGSSWSNAFKSLTNALNYANTNANVDTILIAEGVYKPESYLNPTYTVERSKAFLIKRSNLALVGGYSNGGATYDPNIHKTILSGNIGNQQSDTDNCYKLLVVSSPDYMLLDSIYLNNLTLTKAYANSLDYSYIGNNTVDNFNGGAIFVQNAILNIENCDINNNYAAGKGGGIYSIYSDLYINNSTIQNNNSFRGAGLYVTTSYANIDQNKFNNNVAKELGDAIILELNAYSSISNNIISNHNGSPINTLIQWSEDVNIYNNIFNNNTVNELLSNEFNSLSSLFFFDTGSGNVCNNLFVNNKSKSVLGNYNTINTWRNNIFYNNDYINFENINYSNLVNNGNSFTTNYLHNETTYSNNINGLLDPLFVKEDSIFENGNYRLQFCSPLINVGQNVNFSNYDILNKQRIVGSKIDLGPYEKNSDEIIANNVTVGTVIDSELELLATCEENEWTYYSSSNNPDSVLFAIKWNANNEQVKKASSVSLNINNTSTIITNNNYEGISLLRRFWNIDLKNNQLQEPISVKFYFKNSDFQELNDELNNRGLKLLSDPIWFTMSEKLDPATHINPSNLNQGNISIVTPIIDNSNNILSATFNNITDVTTGGAFGYVGSNTSSIHETSDQNNIKISPNPTNNYIQLSIANPEYNGEKAYIYDLYSKPVLEFTINNNSQINISNLPSGMYILRFRNEIKKFIKD